MLIAQLSDLHICPPGVLCKGVADSNRGLADAIDHLHRLDRRPDLIVLSGDIADDGRPEEYAHALELLRGLRIPFIALPGNHDDREGFRRAFAAEHRYLPAAGRMHYCLDQYPLRLVVLDSTAPDAHYGRLDPPCIDWLAATLAQAPERPTLLLMHHPPFACGIPYLDNYRCFDTAPLEAVVRKHPNIQAVLCGHVHRAMVRRWAGTLVCTCPSTSSEIGLQLAPEAQPQSWLGPRAYLLHLWDPQAGGLVTHTAYVGDYPGPYRFF